MVTKVTIGNNSSFIIQPYRRHYLNDYYQRMSKDNLGVLWDDNVASCLREQGFSIVESPRSIYKVEKLYEALAKYEPRKSPYVNTKDEHFRSGVNLARACFARPANTPKLTPGEFNPEFILEITSNKRASAGLTAWGQTKSEALLRAYERGLQVIKGEKAPDPCLAFKRTQFNEKTRLVWGYPYAMTAIEGLFARPLINRFKKADTPMAFGMSTGVLGAKLRTSSYHKEWAYSTDVSSFDASIPSVMIHLAFDILKTWFDMDAIEPTSGVKYGLIFDMIESYFIHTPIVMPNGNLYKGKRHGVPSGSYFTQMIDSVVNVMMVGAISDAFSLYVDKNDLYVLGDDVLFWSNRFVPLEHISKFATSLFNMTFNAAKSSQFKFNESIHFLGRDWNCGIPSISEEEIIIHMSQPETYRRYPKGEQDKAAAVRKLLLSYAAVYRNAYPIYMRCLDIRPRYNQCNMSIERFVYGKTDDDINADFLSGLQRYLRKYVYESSSGGQVPLAIQFWK